ncbi:MAG: hypothetical protein D3920_02285 [Candidatus Electrothrix sp. AW2]|nr:hypothetical protein [Candidatus Electrothrix gigas]
MLLMSLESGFVLWVVQHQRKIRLGGPMDRAVAKKSSFDCACTKGVKGCRCWKSFIYCNIFCLYLALAQKKQCLVFSEKKDYKRNMMFRRIN